MAPRHGTDQSCQAPRGRRPPLALCCTDPSATAEQLLGWDVDRWHNATTVEDVRAHLGLETQRAWNTRAVGRAVPCLPGVVSLVVLFASALHPHDLPIRCAAWYAKPAATCIDALAAVRRHLWVTANRPDLGPSRPPAHSMDVLPLLMESACYAA